MCNFRIVVEKSIEACQNSENESLNHFVEVNKMVQIGSGSERSIEDIVLSCCSKWRFEEKSNSTWANIFCC